MKQMNFALWTLSLSCLSSIAVASTLKESTQHQSGYFIGVGGSYTATQLTFTRNGEMTATKGVPPLGTFSGTKGSNGTNAQRFAPEAQLGYLKYTPNSNWLLGMQLLYQYSNTTLNDHGFPAYMDVTDPNSSTVDRLSIGSISTKLNNTLILTGFIGHSYKNSFIYLGVGPSLFQTQQHINTIDDRSSAYYIGTLNYISKTQWVLGGALQTGVAYYLNSSWFLKANYTLAFTDIYTNGASSYFTSTLNSGILSFNSQQRIVTQEAALSINKLFSV